ncbi:MAG: tryptophan 7-halogenase, partial [Thermoanaerobaculia bacterium]|nr:tryptophan 7-halogenase [Thermoanaerobaculia bacterium]
MSKDPRDPYDVVVIGGAFSGSSAALLLRRWNPDARILVVERTEAFDRKVGEATVEISAFFLHRVLGLHELLAREHLPKHGLRYWFHRDQESTLEEMSEAGPSEVPRLPAYQLDRSRLDESLIEDARREGIDVLRPARIRSVDLDWPLSTVAVEPSRGARREVGCRWVLDGSGRHAFLARRLRIRRRIEEHPTAAAWGRWRGAADLDGREIQGRDPRAPRLDPIPPARGLATNHFCGHGYWIWTIPLSDGATSVGVVWDKSLFELPEGEGLEERYRRFVLGHPGVREILAPATPVPDDFRAYSHLPYTTDRYMDRGWALLGDAASFLDPYYSAGLDHASISV